MNAVHLAACSFPAWYHRFEGHTFASRIIPLESQFVKYLLADGVFLPDADTVYPTREEVDAYADEDDYQRWPEESAAREDRQQADGDRTEDDEEDVGVSFPEIEAQITQAIQELGGRVVPKLNWSCPKDAVWVSIAQTLECSTPGDIFLLLKSSDRATYDLSDVWEGVEGERVEPVLVLREYFDLQSWREFRCFVKDSKIIGISQRDVTEYFSELQGKEDEMADAILTFHEEKIGDSFPLRDYVMDVYVSKKMRVYIMDFNPVAGTTQPLLFTWDELPYDITAIASGEEPCGGQSGASWIEGEVDVRFITEPVAIRPGARAAYGVPFDFADTSEGSAVDNLIKSMKQAEAKLDTGLYEGDASRQC